LAPKTEGKNWAEIWRAGRRGPEVGESMVAEVAASGQRASVEEEEEEEEEVEV